MRLEVKDVSFHYHSSERAVLADLSLVLEPGSYWCVAGPNGAGKSTFLKLACGLLPIDAMSGTIYWDSRELRTWERLELARNIAFVPGSLKTQFPVSVSDFVIQGRYARSTRLWDRHSEADLRIAEQNLVRVGMATLSDAMITEISAGETQLAMIARALTQEPKVLILDEATAHLDLSYQLKIFDLLNELNNQGMTIVVVSHDVNLAAEFCPNAIWLNGGRLYNFGTMKETLTNNLVQDLYGITSRIEVSTNPFTKKPKIFWK